MLQPKRVKYRKVQKAKGNMKGISGRGNQLSNGMFGIKSLDQNLLTSRQIEAARIAATRYMKREGQLWIKIFPDKPITNKPLEVRMGKGKGDKAPSFAYSTNLTDDQVKSFQDTIVEMFYAMNDYMFLATTKIISK